VFQHLKAWVSFVVKDADSGGIFIFAIFPPVSYSMTSEIVYAVQLAAVCIVQKKARASPSLLGRARTRASPQYLYLSVTDKTCPLAHHNIWSWFLKKFLLNRGFAEMLFDRIDFLLSWFLLADFLLR
jgi:hypothetical protein